MQRHNLFHKNKKKRRTSRVEIRVFASHHSYDSKREREREKETRKGKKKKKKSHWCQYNPLSSIRQHLRRRLLAALRLC